MSTTRVVQGDALAQKADVLVVKYAQGFYGVDLAVSRILEAVHPRANMKPKPGRYVLLPTKGKLGASFVLFVGVVPLEAFDYGQIRSFAFLSMEVLGNALPEATTVVLTVHGPGYGLDEKEAFLSLVAGIDDACAGGSPPDNLSEVRIVELNHGRAQRLTAALEELGTVKRLTRRTKRQPSDHSVEPGPASNRKPHVFVAMPFSEGEMEDVYGFGIQGPVNASGFLCERIDLTAFTGDVVDRIKDRIDTAWLVVADLTGANPNVYLEVGYAWGRGKQTVLLARKGTELKFDIRGHRCLLYSSITDLSKRLASELTALVSAGVIA